jgi:hypothetical protein
VEGAPTTGDPVNNEPTSTFEGPRAGTPLTQDRGELTADSKAAKQSKPDHAERSERKDSFGEDAGKEDSKGEPSRLATWSNIPKL